MVVNRSVHSIKGPRIVLRHIGQFSPPTAKRLLLTLPQRLVQCRAFLRTSDPVAISANGSPMSPFAQWIGEGLECGRRSDLITSILSIPEIR